MDILHVTPGDLLTESTQWTYAGGATHSEQVGTGRPTSSLVRTRGARGSHRSFRGGSRAFLEVLRYERTYDGTFADRGGDALYGSMADVASCEHPGHAGFKSERRVSRESAVAARRGGGEVGTGDDKAVVISGHGRGEPVGVWDRTDEDDQS